MAEHLITHFVDGSDVEIAYDFYDRRIEMTAYDEKTRRRYCLSFGRCTHIDVVYTEEGDINNLTEGVMELVASPPGVRTFTIGFADESVVTISCREFTMIPIEGTGWSFE